MRNGMLKNARELRKNMTNPEQNLWKNLLSHKQTGFKFLRQHPIGYYIPDFYCRELHLIIEIDGDSHAFQEEYDICRTQYFNKIGLQVLRYWNNEVMENLEGVCENIMQWIENNAQSRQPPQSPF